MGVPLVHVITYRQYLSTLQYRKWEIVMSHYGMRLEMAQNELHYEVVMVGIFASDCHLCIDFSMGGNAEASYIGPSSWL